MGEAFQDILIRPFSSLEEYEACVAFQEEVWGEGFSERVSAAILMVANRLGGLSVGAFNSDGKLEGFVFGLTGVQGEELVHWSDMLAVRTPSRDRGLGTRLKIYQRETLLARGVSRMFWTFDPLQSRNAYVNFRKLGIVSREYVRDMYGETGSPLHGGVGTDRLVALWEMDSPRVRERLAGGEPPEAGEEWVGLPRALEGRVEGLFPRPTDPDLSLSPNKLLVAIPREMEGLMREDPPLAIRWREATREALQEYLGRGYEVRELFPDGPLSQYLLCLPSSEEESGAGRRGEEGR
jgi:chorismate synthase